MKHENLQPLFYSYARTDTMEDTTTLSALASNEAMDIMNELRIQKEKLKYIQKKQKLTDGLIRKNGDYINMLTRNGKVFVPISISVVAITFTGYFYLRYFYF